MKNVITRLEDRYPVTLFFALCLIIAWPFIVLRGWAEAGRAGDGVLFYFLAALPVFISQFSPSIVASLLVRNRYGKDGLRQFWGRGLQRPQGRLWLWVALLFPIVIVLSSMVLLSFVGYVSPLTLMNVLQAIGSYFLLLVIGVLFGGISEEFGWRGYLLPILQRKRSALVASVIVGILWAIWHLPPAAFAAFFTDGFSAFAAVLGTSYGMGLVHTIALGIVFTWIFNHTEGSLLLMILLHASSNAAQTAVGGLFTEFPMSAEFIYYGVWWIGALIVLFATGALSLSRIHERWTNILPTTFMETKNSS